MSAPPQTDERLLDLTRPGWLPLPPADGLVAVTPTSRPEPRGLTRFWAATPAGSWCGPATGAATDPGPQRVGPQWTNGQNGRLDSDCTDCLLAEVEETQGNQPRKGIE